MAGGSSMAGRIAGRSWMINGQALAYVVISPQHGLRAYSFLIERKIKVVA